MKWSKNLLDKAGRFAPLAYMAFHLVFYSVTHILAIVSFHYYWVSMALSFSMVACTLWNGACYYMDFFAKKYEQQLAQLSSIQKEIEIKKEEEDKTENQKKQN